MRKLTALMAAGLVLGMSGMAMAAGETANSDAGVTVTLIKPITITNVTALKFGKMVRNAAESPANIVLTAGSGTAYTNLTAVPGTGNDPAAATFTVGGMSGSAFSIGAVQKTSPGTGFTVSDFVFAGAGGTGLTVDVSTGTLGSAETGTLSVGGTLTIDTTAVASATENTTGAITVTVAYN